MNFTEWKEGVGFYVSTAAFAFTLILWLVARAEKRTEQRKREGIETEMREIQRRGRAPFLRASNLHVPPQGQTGNQIFHLGKHVIPEFTGDGVTLMLDLANDGEEVRNVADDWTNGEGLELTPWGIRQDASRAARLVYKYLRSKHGQPMRITIRFETMDGLKLHHVYELRHGFCEFDRIDPA